MLFISIPLIIEFFLASGDHIIIHQNIFSFLVILSIHCSDEIIKTGEIKNEKIHKGASIAPIELKAEDNKTKLSVNSFKNHNSYKAVLSKYYINYDPEGYCFCGDLDRVGSIG